MPSRRGRRGRPIGFPQLDSFLAPAMESVPSLLDAPLPVTASDGITLAYPVGQQSVSSRADSHLSQIYYSHFHPAHPFLPPRHAWVASSPSQYLIELVEYIALHYSSPPQGPDRIYELQAAVNDAGLSVEKCQAYLLLSILLHARCMPEGARECIGYAIETCLELGLHRREFSNVMEMQSPVHAESARRTWWEIFVVDTLLATVQAGGVLQFTLETPDLPLPCEDCDYVDGRSDPASLSVKDLDRLALFSDQGRLSSLAYRVEATLILRQCLIAGETGASQESLDSLDATISAWFHRWPSSKRSILRQNGELDQIDHQTAMVMHCASIYLHFPKSFLLSFLPTTGHVFCSRPPAFPSPAMSPHMHTAKVVSAGVELSKLASLSQFVTNSSPFFCCTLVLSSIIQLATLSANAGQPLGKYHSFLALNMGVLNSMGATWTIAANSMGRLRAVALEIETAFAEQARYFADNLLFVPALQ